MPKRIFLVTATKAKTEEEFKKRPIAKSLEKLCNIYDLTQFDFHVEKNNKNGLSSVYNKFLTEEHKNDIVLFVHDDVIISDLFLVEHLRKSPYTVTGLAGTTSYNIASQKCAWHLMSKREDWRGEVRHIKDNNIWTSVFGRTPSNASLIDGLFIAVNIENILKTQARFNEQFKFHCYDLAFCIECERNNVSCGVLPISVIHYGLGDSMLTKEWEEANLKFKEVYTD